jgi:hypothetical protein
LGPNDQQHVVAKLEYVGWIEKILQLNYEVLNTIVFFCNWVKANYIGNNATIKKDEYGFTFVNFTSLIPISNQSVTFPIHVQQVFFSNDPKEQGWKVVLHKDPRGKQVAGGVEFDPQTLDMFRIEIDDRYTSL